MPSHWDFFRNRLPIHVPGPSYRATRGYFIGRARERKSGHEGEQGRKQDVSPSFGTHEWFSEVLGVRTRIGCWSL